ncbi:MAG: outer membrane beta-barrel protein, partial [Bacteroidota bacterium]
TLSLLLFCLPLVAQVNTKGFFLGGGFAAGSIAYNEDNIDETAGSGGFGLRIGYGFSPTFTLYANLAGYRAQGQENTLFREDYNYGIFELGGRFYFGQKIKPVVFYADVALQAVSALPIEDPEIRLNGGGLTLGPGLLVFLGDKFALDFGLRLSGGSITEVETDFGSINLSNDNFNYGWARLNFGVAWYPSN